MYFDSFRPYKTMCIGYIRDFNSNTIIKTFSLQTRDLQPYKE